MIVTVVVLHRVMFELHGVVSGDFLCCVRMVWDECCNYSKAI